MPPYTPITQAAPQEPTTTIVERWKVRCLPTGNSHTLGYIELDNLGRYWFVAGCRASRCYGELRLRTDAATVKRLVSDGQAVKVVENAAN